MSYETFSKNGVKLFRRNDKRGLYVRYGHDNPRFQPNKAKNEPEDELLAKGAPEEIGTYLRDKCGAKMGMVSLFAEGRQVLHVGAMSMFYYGVSWADFFGNQETPND